MTSNIESEAFVKNNMDLKYLRKDQGQVKVYEEVK